MNFREKECQECGNLFTPTCGTQVYCRSAHTTYCEFCHNPFTYKCSPNEKPKYCSKECRIQGVKANNLAKYGVENVSKLPEVRKAISEIRRNPTAIRPKAKVVTMKKCKVCGKEFKANGTQVYCNNVHTKTCIVCNELFVFNPRHPHDTCSPKCARKNNMSQATKKCAICGKEFTPNNNTSLYCSDPHYRPCPVCGKLVRYYSLNETVVCCSPECTKIKRRQTCYNRYGESVPSKSAEVRAKLQKASYLSQSKRQATCLERFGVDNPAKAVNIQNKISKTVASSECQSKITNTCLARYGVRHSSQLAEIHKKSSASRSIITASDGQKVDSSYEALFYNFLLFNNIPFEYQSKEISYLYDNRMHKTFIDFTVGDFHFECKGSHLLEGCFDHVGVPIATKLNVYKENNVILITDSLGRDLLKNNNYPIGIDIALFGDPHAVKLWDRLLLSIENNISFIDEDTIVKSL